MPRRPTVPPRHPATRPVAMAPGGSTNYSCTLTVPSSRDIQWLANHTYTEGLSKLFHGDSTQHCHIIQAVFGFDYGDEFEVACCQALRQVIPHRFGICRGHVVNQSGEQAGDDIIIYDRHVFPTLRLLPQEDYSRKEWIPIEAVAAYIEAKHTLQIAGDSGQSLAKACDQIGKVKLLVSQRPQVPLNEVSRHVLIGGETKIVGGASLPQMRNPVYCMIFAPHARKEKNDPVIVDATQTLEALRGYTFNGPGYPDFVLAGKSNVILPGTVSGDGQTVTLRLFTWGADVKLIPLVTPSVAFGVALTTLLTVLDSISLGALPWQAILQDSLNPERYKSGVAPSNNDGSSPMPPTK